MADYMPYELFTLTYLRKDNGQIITRIIVPLTRANGKSSTKVSRKGAKMVMCARFRTWADAELWLAKDLARVRLEKDQRLKSSGPTVSLISVGKYLNSVYRDSFRNYLHSNIISINRIIINPSTMDKVKMKAQDIVNKVKQGLNRWNPFSKANKYSGMVQGKFNVGQPNKPMPSTGKPPNPNMP